MPLFYQHTINETIKLGIWQIEEDEGFFLKKVPVQQDITHPHKRLQHLAGRYLLQYLFADFPYEEILIADTRKPYLKNEQYHFSISHCGSYAAAIVSSTHRVGIDIEIPSEKVERIAHKFIHKKEQQFLVNDEGLIADNSLFTSHRLLFTILWSAKEALFKWYSLGKVDFRQDMQLRDSIQQHGDILMLPFVFKKEGIFEKSIHSRIFDDLVLSWII